MVLPDRSTRLSSEPERCVRSAADLLVLGSLLVSAPVALAFLDRQLRFLKVSDALAAISGLPSAAHRQRSLHEVAPHLCAPLLPGLLHVLATGATIRDVEISEPAGDAACPQRHWLVSCYPLREETGRIMGVGMVLLDISARKRREAQLLQAQKLDALGRLDGAIAHEFNNLLTAMAGYVMLALAALPTESSARADLCELQRCTERAADLTSQLLAVTRSRREAAALIDLNRHILRLARLLRQLLGEDIALDVRLTAQDAVIGIDAGQLEQLIINLAVNARDAMPGGGRLRIETAVLELEERAGAGALEVKAGPYVRLSVSDSGVGMDQQTQQRAFEPFFTTKAPGKGTGLGLAICSSIVEQHGGTMVVQSEVGQGTTVSVCFPRIAEQPATSLQAASEALIPNGTETILVVEQDAAVREVIARCLRAQGYRVQSASDGAEALSVARACAPARIDLLLTDVVLPGMSGPSLAAALATVYPDMAVLYISEYRDHTSVGQLHSDEAALMHKPLVLTELGWQVRPNSDSVNVVTC